MKKMIAYVEGNEADGLFLFYSWQLKEGGQIEARGECFLTFEEALADCKAKTPVVDFEIKDREHPIPVAISEIPEGEDVQYVRLTFAMGSVEVEGEPMPPRW